MVCDICRSKENNDLELGQIMTMGGISVHYFCLLLSTNLPQKGKDSAGILGFFLRDIRKEIIKAANRPCVYCKEKHASIKCATCSVYFHLVCGLRKNCRFHFIDEFISFCHNHHGVVHKNPHSIDQICHICLNEMGEYNPITSITATCCLKDFWLHINCLKEYALSAGYYLKCLFCGDLKFRDEVRRLGVFVPDRDAQVEREKGAFRELYQKYSRCDALTCECEKGRDYNTGVKWKIVVCNTCGQSGIHTICSPKQLAKTVFQCETCQSILNQTLANKSINENSNEFFDTTLYLPKSQVLFEDDKPLNTDRPTSRQLPEIIASVSRKSTDPIPIKSPETEICLLLDLGNSTAKICEATKGTSDIIRCQDMEEYIDEDLIHKLVADLKKTHRLHNEVISVSDDTDDTVQSAEELFEEMSRPKAKVPLPMKDPHDKTNDAKCVTISDRVACQLRSNESSSDLPRFVHSSPPSSTSLDKLASSRLDHFFKNFTDPPPPSD